MKRKLAAFLTFLLLFIACSKHNTSADQASELLEKKWTFLSESFIYAPNPSLDSTYAGISFNYFQFTSSNTIIASLGNPAISSYTTNYFLQNDTTVLIYSQNSISQYVTYHIQKLDQDSLILLTPAIRVIDNSTYSGNEQIVFYQ